MAQEGAASEAWTGSHRARHEARRVFRAERAHEHKPLRSEGALRIRCCEPRIRIVSTRESIRVGHDSFVFQAWSKAGCASSRFLWIAMLVVLRSLAFAELRWDKDELAFHPAPTDSTVTAEFAFTTTGRESVTIESVQASCACITAKADRKTYRPGEKGLVTAVFDLGQRTGVQDKKIAVKIEGESEPVTLRMVVHIPELAKLTPQLVFWESGEALSAKVINLTLKPDASLRIIRIACPDPRFAARLDTIEAGRAYQVVITPTQTTTPATAVVTIEGVVGSEKRRFFQAYAQVRSAAPRKPAPRP